MTPYVNIHTHHECSPEQVAIINVLANQKKPGDITTFFSVGLHPWHLESVEKTRQSMQFVEEALRSDNCLAVGEAGLDKICKSPWELQIDAFLQQIHLAQEYQKPVIIHCVKAYNELLKIRKEMTAPTPWIFHGFHSSNQMAIQLLQAGCVLSFGKSLFSGNDKLIQLFISLDEDAFFLETDDEPLTIKEVYEQAARLRKVSVEELRKQQQQNFNALF